MSKIICAIDTDSIEEAKNLIVLIKNDIYGIKLGLEFFVANGPNGVREIAKFNLPIFLDLKFYDIPNTVAKAVKNACLIDNVFMLTIHSLAGLKAFEKIREELDTLNLKTKPMIIGVTILTSYKQDDLYQIGINKNVTDAVCNLAKLSYQGNLDGVVCSPLEIKMLRDKFSDRDKFKLIVPGIRDVLDNSDDQARIMDAKTASYLGADYLVIGRPITKAADPRAKAKEICLSIS